MDSSSSRFVAALLSQVQGSEVVESMPGLTAINLALIPIKHVVIVLEASEHRVQMTEQVKHAVATAKLGVPLHVVLVNPTGVDVTEVLKEQIPLLQMKAVSGWNWVPGKDAELVRGPTLPQVISAVKLANSSASLSLDEMKVASHREADVVRGFQQQVMQRKPLVSWAIAVTCVAMFALQMLWGDGEPVMSASRMGALIPSKVMAGDWWRLFSVMLLHANFIHLFMNMLAMLSFGPFLERLMGSGRYLVLFVLSGLGGSLLSLQRGGDIIGVGASGGIWGLMVAGAVVVTWPRGLLPASLALQMRQRAWTPVAINLFYSLQPGIDMLAHVGGGIVGGLLVMVLTRGAVPNEPLKPARVFNALAVIVGLVLATSMGIALAKGRPWELSGPWNMQQVKLEGTGLSITIPEGLELAHEPGSNLWHFGELNSTGAEIIIEVAAQEAEDVDFSHALEELVAGEVEVFKGLHYSQKPKLTRLGSGRDVVFAEMIPDDKDDVRFLWKWWAIEDRRWVLVLANALNTTKADRRAQLVQVADSLQKTP